MVVWLVVLGQCLVVSCWWRFCPEGYQFETWPVCYGLSSRGWGFLYSFIRAIPVLGLIVDTHICHLWDLFWFRADPRFWMRGCNKWLFVIPINTREMNVFCNTALKVLKLCERSSGTSGYDQIITKLIFVKKVNTFVCVIPRR